MRYQTAADLGSDLRRLRRGDTGSVTAVVATSSRSGRLRVITAVSVIAAMAFAGAYVVSHRNAGPDYSSVTLKQLTTTGHVGVAGISPDGRYVAPARVLV